MVTEYRGREQWPAYLEVLQEADRKGGTISPGGAAMLLRVTRQRIYELCETHQDIHAWAYYEDWRPHVANYEVSVPDLLRWAVRVGRIKREEDLGLPWPRLKEQVRNLLQEVGV